MSEFKHLLKQFGSEVKVIRYINNPDKFNEETNQALVKDKPVSEGFHDIVVSGNFLFNIGDMITYKNNNYLVVSDVQENDGMYKGLAREISIYSISVIVQDEVRNVTERDQLGTPIEWDVIQPEIKKDFPTVIHTQVADISSDGYFRFPDNQYLISTPYHQNIAQGDTINLFDHDYEVVGVDKSKTYRDEQGNIGGLLILNVKW